jgi:hypothetical protein
MIHGTVAIARDRDEGWGGVSFSEESAGFQFIRMFFFLVLCPPRVCVPFPPPALAPSSSASSAPSCSPAWSSSSLTFLHPLLRLRLLKFCPSPCPNSTASRAMANLATKILDLPADCQAASCLPPPSPPSPQAIPPTSSALHFAALFHFHLSYFTAPFAARLTSLGSRKPAASPQQCPSACMLPALHPHRHPLPGR